MGTLPITPKEWAAIAADTILDNPSEGGPGVEVDRAFSPYDKVAVYQADKKYFASKGVDIEKKQVMHGEVGPALAELLDGKVSYLQYRTAQSGLPVPGVKGGARGMSLLEEAERHMAQRLNVPVTQLRAEALRARLGPPQLPVQPIQLTSPVQPPPSSLFPGQSNQLSPLSVRVEELRSIILKSPFAETQFNISGFFHDPLWQLVRPIAIELLRTYRLLRKSLGDTRLLPLD